MAGCHSCGHMKWWGGALLQFVNDTPDWSLPIHIWAKTESANALHRMRGSVCFAGGAVAISSVVAGNTVVVPRLKQLPESAVKLQAVRAKLLAQHSSLVAKMKVAMQETSDDVVVLARLWQLQSKMESVSDSGTYETRIQRVGSARQNLEARVSKRLELLDGYSRVVNMIEIEVSRWKGGCDRRKRNVQPKQCNP